MMNVPIHHVNVNREQMSGNQGRGRVVFLPGSEGRAKAIAGHFDDLEVYPSPRQLNVYTGRISDGDTSVDVAAVSSGMGCPSVGIVVAELFSLGVRRVLRVGSSGSLQQGAISTGDLVIASAAVRDEAASDSFCPRDVPAVAHLDWVRALSTAAEDLGVAEHAFVGTVHTKDSLYGREFPMGPLQAQNHSYMQILKDMGVLATEMESSHLFTLAALYGRPPVPVGRISRGSQVKAGTVLAIIGDDKEFAPPAEVARAEGLAVEVALRAAIHLIRAEDATAP